MQIRKVGIFGTPKDRGTCGHPGLPCKYAKLECLGPQGPVHMWESSTSICGPFTGSKHSNFLYMDMGEARAYLGFQHSIVRISYLRWAEHNIIICYVMLSVIL